MERLDKIQTVMVGILGILDDCGQEKDDISDSLNAVFNLMVLKKMEAERKLLKSDAV